MPKKPVIITQEQLEESVKNYRGVEVQMRTGKKDKDGEPETEKITLRDLLIQVIFTPDGDREPNEKLRGHALAQKVAGLMGELKLNEKELELIRSRADENEMLDHNDYLYGILNDALKG